MDAHESPSPGHASRTVTRRGLLKTSAVVTSGYVAARALNPWPASADGVGTLSVLPTFYPLQNAVTDIDLHNKVALITGASRGLGRAAAEALAGQGVRVFGTSRDPKSVPNPPSYPLLQLDITDANSIKQLDKNLGKLLGSAPLSILVNNAGRVPLGDTVTPPGNEDRYKEMAALALRTIYQGHVDVTTTLLPRIPRTGYGRVMFTISAAAFLSGESILNGDVSKTGFEFYSGAKRALYNYANALRWSVADTSLRVSTVNPLFAVTGLADHPHPIYLQPVDKDGNDPNGPNTSFSQAIQLVRGTIANGFPAGLVGTTYAQLAASSNPEWNVIVGAQSGPIAAQGQTSFVEAIVVADNAVSPMALSSV